MNNGWIKLHRQILEDPYLKGKKLALWTTLLLLATHKEYEELFCAEKIVLNPGQLIIGRKYLAEKSGYSESGVEGVLASFEKQQQIRQQTSTKNRLITIVNWGQYQGDRQMNQQQTDNKKTRTIKKEKKEDKYINELERFSTTYQLLSGKKIKSIQRRLPNFVARRQTFSYEEMEEATKQMLADSFMCGVNDNKRFFATIDYVLKKDENIETWLNSKPIKHDESKRKKDELLGDFIKRTL